MKQKEVLGRILLSQEPPVPLWKRWELVPKALSLLCSLVIWLAVSAAERL